MAQGFLSGALLGGVLSLGAVSVVSVISPVPQTGAPQETPAALPEEESADAPQDTTVAESAAVDVDVDVDVASGEAETTQQAVEEQAAAAEVAQIAPQVSDAAPAEASAPVTEGTSLDRGPQVIDAAPQSAASTNAVAAPQEDAPAQVDTTAIAPVERPQTEAATNLEAPQAGPSNVDIALSGEDPVLPNPQALAPMIPQEADGVAVDTAPADRPQAEAVAQTQIDPASESSDTGTIAQSEAAQPASGSNALGAEATVQEAEAAPETPAIEQTEAQAPQVAAVDPPARVTAPDASGETAAETAQAATEATTENTQTAATETAETETTEVAILAPAAPRQIGTPAISLTERSGSVVVNRLGTRLEDATEDDVTVITDAGTDAEPGDPRPLVRYAAKFDNPENKPLMSIILIDDGSNPTSGAAGIAALRAFPYSLTFAVDTGLPDAAERMALYREEGFEVLAMVDLPEGAQPTDVETTLGAILPQMRGVVGVLEGTAAGLQASREVSDQVTAILAQSGHGLVTQDKGLNTMPKLARKEGLPANPIFRDFDSKGQTATVIRRFLDQAAFKAGREGAVIMLGRLRPDTISALLLWGLQDRAGQVALAPISAVLTRDDG